MGLHWVDYLLPQISGPSLHALSIFIIYKAKFQSSNLKNLKNKQFFNVAADTLGQKLKQLCIEFDRVFAKVSEVKLSYPLGWHIVLCWC